MLKFSFTVLPASSTYCTIPVPHRLWYSKIRATNYSNNISTPSSDLHSPCLTAPTSPATTYKQAILLWNTGTTLVGHSFRLYDEHMPSLLQRTQQQSFYGPLSGTIRVSRYRKKHSPTHHPDHHPVFISFFHLLRSIASSLFKLHAWQSFHTTSFHVLFGLPLGL